MLIINQLAGLLMWASQPPLIPDLINERPSFLLLDPRVIKPLRQAIRLRRCLLSDFSVRTWAGAKSNIRNWKSMNRRIFWMFKKETWLTHWPDDDTNYWGYLLRAVRRLTLRWKLQILSYFYSFQSFQSILGLYMMKQYVVKLRKLFPQFYTGFCVFDVTPW